MSETNVTPMPTVTAHSTVPLDPISLDGFEIETRSGEKIYPHAGQTVWLYSYGRNTATVRKLAAAHDSGDQLAGLDQVCRLAAEEIAKHDVRNPRTGEPFPWPDHPDEKERLKLRAAVVAEWPDPLLAYVVRQIMGVESEGEGSADSGS